MHQRLMSYPESQCAVTSHHMPRWPAYLSLEPTVFGTIRLFERGGLGGDELGADLIMQLGNVSHRAAAEKGGAAAEI